MDRCDRLRLEHPVLQGGIGGGLATADLAAAVSRGEGLGTIGTTSLRRPIAEVRHAKELAPEEPIAANLLPHGSIYVARRGDVVLLPAAVGACVIRPKDSVTVLEMAIPVPRS